ncbi:MAG: aldolase, partial [Verrucomicrobia bacterium]|nr:aldolase [Verrucomicrobiota bacterium]
KLVKEGVAGIIVGRNVIQHKTPEKMTQALRAIMHENASASDALGFLKS